MRNAVLISLCALASAAGLIFFAYISAKTFSPDAYASRIFKACTGAPYPPSCYDAEVPKLMDEGLTMEQSFSVLSHVVTLTKNTSYPYYFCHIPAHLIAAKEVAKDPVKWADVINRCPVGECSNGCLHGAFQERFRNDAMTDTEIQNIVPALKTICSSHEGKDFTNLEVTACYHALGHLTMYIAGGDVKRATKICDTVVPAESRALQGIIPLYLHRRTCYEGAFMQLYQPLEPEDKALVKDFAPKTAAEAHAFCQQFRQYPDGIFSACNVESWPLQLAKVQTPQGLQAFCSLTPTAKWIERCYNDLFYIISSELDPSKSYNPAVMTPFCKALPKDRMAQCFADSAAGAVETDYQLAPVAAQFCAVAQLQGVGDACYERLLYYSTYNYHFGSLAFKTFCNALPSPWNSKCLQGAGLTLMPKFLH